MDKNKKPTKAAREKAEEEALNRILCWVAGGTVLEFLLLLLNRYYYRAKVSEYAIVAALDVAVKILAVAGLLCAAAAFYWWNGARKARKSAMLPATLGFFMLGVSAGCFAAWFFYGSGIRLMYVAVPVVVVLAVIFYLYQREFFLIACESALTLLVVWICAKGLGGRYAMIAYACVALAALAVVAVAGVCRKAQAGNGVMEVNGKDVRFFAKDANYALLYLGAIILLLVLILGAIGISQMALYAVTVAWLLVAAVYYTVKLM